MELYNLVNLGIGVGGPKHIYCHVPCPVGNNPAKFRPNRPREQSSRLPLALVPAAGPNLTLPTPHHIEAFYKFCLMNFSKKCTIRGVQTQGTHF